MKTNKKWLCLLLALCLCASALITVQALPGAEVRYTRDGGTTWTEATLTDAIWNNLMQKNVTIELLRNITLDGGYGMTCGGPNSNLTIDGKGFTVTRGENTSLFYTIDQENATVTLKNITFDGGAVWNSEDPAARTDTSDANNSSFLLTVRDGATLILEDGAVLQNNNLGNTSYGAAVYLESGGTLIMKPGSTICKNAAQVGGAVCIDKDASFALEGGKLYGNYAYSGGGAVFTEGDFTMSGGEIYQNASGNNGGAVCVSGGSFTLTGGKLYKNKSTVGGGAVTLLANASVQLQGGQIYENTITGKMGGGILINSGTLSAEGAPIVTGNQGAESAANNIYLPDGKTIALTGALTEKAALSLTMKTPGTFTIGWSQQMDANVKPAAYFTEDSGKYCAVQTAEGECSLQEHTTQLQGKSEATCGQDGYTGDTVCTVCDKILTSGQKIDATGQHSFGEWTVTKEATEKEEGQKERVCTVCQAKETDIIPQKANVKNDGDISLLSLWLTLAACIGGTVLYAKKKRAAMNR